MIPLDGKQEKLPLIAATTEKPYPKKDKCPEKAFICRNTPNGFTK
jgi:hypothetical protein